MSLLEQSEDSVQSPDDQAFLIASSRAICHVTDCSSVVLQRSVDIGPVEASGDDKDLDFGGSLSKVSIASKNALSVITKIGVMLLRSQDSSPLQPVGAFESIITWRRNRDRRTLTALTSCRA